jgi:hypothetical protein
VVESIRAESRRRGVSYYRVRVERGYRRRIARDQPGNPALARVLKRFTPDELTTFVDGILASEMDC